VQAKAEDALRDKARAGAIGTVQDYTHLAQLGCGDRKMIEVVFDIIVGAIECGLPTRSSPAQDGHVAHDVLEGRLNLWRPLGRASAAVGGRDRVISRQPAQA
jgi:hypothetical protein